jgi:hypothetical protein
MDRAYGGTISIPNDADRKRRNLLINTARAWFDLTAPEREAIHSGERIIDDFFRGR